MKKTTILWALCIHCLISCRSDEVSPSSQNESINEKIQNLMIGNKIQIINGFQKFNKVVYLKNTKSEYQFLSSFKDKVKSTNQSSKILPIIRVKKGIFTFTNGQKATIYFDRDGEIASLDVDGDVNLIYTYDESTGYIEIIKWAIVALPLNKEMANHQLIEYQYYNAPVVRWYANLKNGYWSGIHFLDIPEGANFEGKGDFEMFYNPVTDPFFPID